MTRKSTASIYLFLLCLVGIRLCLLPLQALSQSLAIQPQQTVLASVQPKAISLPHLYWHFLIHQNVLDSRAATLESQGKSDNGLRNDLQGKLGFSDADYIPVRASSRRLASKLQGLGTEAKGMQTPLHPRLDPDQIANLKVRQEADINQEVFYLTDQLTPQNKAKLDAFLVQFFAPKQLSFKVPPSVASLAGKAAK